MNKAPHTPAGLCRLMRCCLALTVTLSLLLVSCGNKDPEEHVHVPLSTWASDSATHWHGTACTHTEDIRLNEAPHTPVTVPGRPATEGEAGTTDSVQCSVCGYVITPATAIPATGHTYAEVWSSDSEGHWHAATCSHTEARADYAAHTVKTIPGRAPTATASGLSDGKVCEVCGYVIQTQQLIPPLGDTDQNLPGWVPKDPSPVEDPEDDGGNNTELPLL